MSIGRPSSSSQAAFPLETFPQAEIRITERFFLKGQLLTRQLGIGTRIYESTMPDASALPADSPPWSRWWRSFILGTRPRTTGSPQRYLNAVDLFCGCGGLALGFREAAEAVRLQPVFRLAVDVDAAALEVFAANLGPMRTLPRNVSSLVEYQIEEWDDRARFAYQPELIDAFLASARGLTDVLLAGPPCEGHSNLNNHTRRNDPRNLLLLDAIAIGVALQTRALLIENVPDIRNDRRGTVATAVSLLHSEGYDCTYGVIAGDQVGLPQRRRRFFLAASKRPLLAVDYVKSVFQRGPETVRWAIGDLVGRTEKELMDVPARLSHENRRRVEYLFAHDEYDLPNDIRPECHRNGHTYPSVYGRLRWDEPAGTITTGFLSPGRGRFIHPALPRTLTPHEAARIQTFPDWFSFVARPETPPTKAQLTKWIGDAVPPLLAYVAAMTILPGFSCGTWCKNE